MWVWVSVSVEMGVDLGLPGVFRGGFSGVFRVWILGFPRFRGGFVTDRG